MHRRPRRNPGCAMPNLSNPGIPVPAPPSKKSCMARRTERKAEAYIDTSAFIAFLDRSDSYHALYRRLFSQPPSLVTSGLVIAEGHGWFLRRYDFNRAV